jgi:nitroreductase
MQTHPSSLARAQLRDVPALNAGIPHESSPAADAEFFGIAQALIESRQNVSPKRLDEPGPSPQQFVSLMSLAAAAPDHGLLTPWRFIVVPTNQRQRLAEVFALALIDRDPGATPEQIESAREKAYRAPLLMVAVGCLGPRAPDTPRLERMISMGAAVQNLLLGAHAMGFGAGLTSGQAMKSPRMRELCGLAHEEFAVCCVNIGTVSKRKAVARLRPQHAQFVSTLKAPASAATAAPVD